MEPMPGDLFCAQITGLTGLGIRTAQRIYGCGQWSKWTHAGVYLGDGNILEAEPGGAQINRLDSYQGRPLLWSTGLYELSGETRKAIVDAAFALQGIPYSFIDYASIGLHRYHVRPAWVERYVMSTGHQICSQAADEAWLRGGVHLFEDGRLPQDVVPGDLARLFDQRRIALGLAA